MASPLIYCHSARDTSQQKATLLFHYYAKRIQCIHNVRQTKSPQRTHTHVRLILRECRRDGEGQGQEVGWVGGMIHAMANFLTPVNKRRGQNICLVRLNGANGCCKSVCPSVCQYVCVCVRDIYLLVNIFIVRRPLCIPDYFISPRSANSIYF